MFKPAHIDTRRGRIPVSDEARQAARAGMGGEQTARAAVAAVEKSPVTGFAPLQSSVPPSAGSEFQQGASTELIAPPEGVASLPAASSVEPEHSVKLPRAVVQEIKLSLALLAGRPGSPASIKQYLERAHRLLDAELRRAGQLPPAAR